MSQQLEGFFLSFSAKEMTEIRSALERQGYTPDNDGIKKALMEGLFSVRQDDDIDEGELTVERVIRQAKSFVASNPETIAFGMKAIGGIMKNVAGKIKR